MLFSENVVSTANNFSIQYNKLYSLTLYTMHELFPFNTSNLSEVSGISGERAVVYFPFFFFSFTQFLTIHVIEDSFVSHV